jgi:CHAD domain-containing protein
VSESIGECVQEVALISQRSYLALKNVSIQEFINHLSANFSLNTENTFDKKVTYFDTFDWRLFRNNLNLLNEEDQLHLSYSDGKSICSEKWIYTSAPGLSDLPTRFQEKLDKIIDIRTLLLIAECNLTIAPINVLNVDRKTVLRLYIENLNIKKSDDEWIPKSLLLVDPVRGYEKEDKKFRQFLESYEQLEAADSLFAVILGALNITPGAYSSKPDFRLGPDQPAGLAMHMILDQLFEIMNKNIPGIIKDIDTEFLHDYRVAIRRTRSALSQVKNIFSEKESERFKKDFRYLGKQTNRLRDLDVYLLRKNEYMNYLPKEIQKGLDPIFKSLAKEREKEFRRVTGQLNSAKTKKILDEWQAFLAAVGQGKMVTGENFNKPVDEIAETFIKKRLEKTLQFKADLDHQPADSDLHQLRIECKKLRYLFEFFRSLFAEKEISTMIKHLKKLQDNLGTFNDLSVQQQMLRNLQKNNDFSDTAVMAIGGLITVLNKKQLETKNQFEQIFTLFKHNVNPDTLNTLLTKGE